MATERSIGATLRDARLRRKLDLPAAESETKIRVRYLRALENEEWDVLPGGSYTRSFIRTYGDFLGLDGDRLADVFRRTVGEGDGAVAPRIDAPPVGQRRAARRGAPRLSRGALAAIVSLALIAALIAIALLTGDGGSDTGSAPRPPQGGAGDASPAPGRPGGPPRFATVEITAEAPVWVCLTNEKGNPLIDGRILQPGAREGPFRSGSFEVAFGNGSVRMTVNGEQAPTQSTPNPIGYRISVGGRLRPLADSDRPTCA